MRTTDTAEATDTRDETDAAGKGSRQSRVLAIVWVNPDGASLTSWLTHGDELVVGRAEDCETVLPGSLVSRQHARLTRTQGNWFIEDLGSRNGVRLDGSLLCLRMQLREGAVLRIGSWVGVAQSLAAAEEPRFDAFGDGLFGGPALRRPIELLRVAATSGFPVVVEGETGTGKELFARAIHARSQRGGAFVAINCAMYQPGTAVAELFGHRKGAFTGAGDAHAGLIRAAEGGTLLLDEVTDLPLDVQAQLLRVIENRELIPLGGAKAVPVDVRFLSATQKSLSRAVAEGRFRSDLRARLEGLRIELPSLRKRLLDVPFLFLHLMREHSTHPPRPDAQVLEQLCLYDWPLNVREMVAFVRRLLAAYPKAATLSVSQVMPLFPERANSTGKFSALRAGSARRRRVDSRAFSADALTSLRAALERHSGSVAKAAAELKITRQRAYRLLKNVSR
jgi:DNA-binding NtrC family response regulator